MATSLAAAAVMLMVFNSSVAPYGRGFSFVEVFSLSVGTRSVFDNLMFNLHRTITFCEYDDLEILHRVQYLVLSPRAVVLGLSCGGGGSTGARVRRRIWLSPPRRCSRSWAHAGAVLAHQLGRAPRAVRVSAVWRAADAGRAGPRTAADRRGVDRLERGHGRHVPTASSRRSGRSSSSGIAGA